MKTKIFIALAILLAFSLALTSCGKECIKHIFDKNNVCIVCGHTESGDDQNGDDTDNVTPDDTNQKPDDGDENDGDNTVGDNTGNNDNNNNNNATKFTVTFDSRGGSKVSSQQVTSGGKAQKPADPTKEGYTFDGWYIDGEKWSFVGYVVTEDMTLTAKWITNVYTVTFVNEFDNVLYTTEVEHGEKLTAPSTPSKSGCSFIGWFNGNATWSFKKDKVTSDIVLKQKWVTNISYFLDGGYNSSNNPTTVYSDDFFPIILDDPSKSGYIFAGWYTDPNFTNQVNCIYSFDSYTLYAKWINENQNTPWSTTTLIYQLTDNSNYHELPSTCRRYLAGDLAGITDQSTIDEWVYYRNEAALEAANVRIEYQYLPDTSNYSWGQNIDTIDCEVKSRDPQRPDMYCNFVYDMVAVSLKGSFANLLSTTMYKDGHELAGLNYFEFADNPWLNDTGDGYLIDYMRSLTLSKYKLYCLASDYYIDLVRAFTVIPVNIALLETLQTGGTYNEITSKGDFLADRVTTWDSSGYVETNYTIEDFYQLINDLEWNYANLALFSEAIFSEGSEGDDIVDLRDTVGFALSTSSGLGASAMLYSTPITLIDRVYDADKGDYTYSYPYMVQQGSDYNVSFIKGEGTHEELMTFCDNLTTLFSSKGVIAVTNNTHGINGQDTDLKAIRSRFASNNVLFGGVVCLGSLEYDEYQLMNVSGQTGYGIAPIPLYRTNYVDAFTGEVKYDHYMTQIHSIGKVGAISYTTEKFAQCTAYLNYQSTHSTDILNEYYEYKLQYDVVGATVKGNVEMLKYIRYNVRSSFDKTFEDALGKFYNATDEMSMKQQWHSIIRDGGFRVTGDEMAYYYDSYAPIKAWRLYNLENYIYPTLPD